jgi:prolipoprotein diacylglyceryltransferase
MPAPVLRAALSYYALVFAAGFVLGSIRVGLLVPRLGVRMAELTEMPFMLVVIFVAARFISVRFDLPASATQRLAVGALALVFLVAAELLLAFLLLNQTPTEHITDRDPVSGSVYLGMLGLFALMPLLVRRR